MSQVFKGSGVLVGSIERLILAFWTVVVINPYSDIVYGEIDVYEVNMDERESIVVVIEGEGYEKNCEDQEPGQVVDDSTLVFPFLFKSQWRSASELHTR